jgi:2-polyprenyl-6-methoxyphenol hydroxylase-like FAD-dependent oxidoreductase
MSAATMPLPLQHWIEKVLFAPAPNLWRGWVQVPRLLAEMDAADDFYFDSISQIVMDSWIKGRVTLVGDAGCSPGPAVGGGTSIAMVGAYVLAQELGGPVGTTR